MKLWLGTELNLEFKNVLPQVISASYLAKCNSEVQCKWLEERETSPREIKIAHSELLRVFALETQVFSLIQGFLAGATFVFFPDDLEMQGRLRRMGWLLHSRHCKCNFLAGNSKRDVLDKPWRCPVVPTVNEFRVYYMSSSKNLKKTPHGLLWLAFYCVIPHHSFTYHIWSSNVMTYKILLLASLSLFILSFLRGLFLWVTAAQTLDSAWV